METVEYPKTADAEVTPKVRPRLREWLWRPWYAKLWWGASVVYWLSFLANWQAALGLDFFQSTAGGYASLAFHPFTILILLSVGFVRAFFSTGDWEWVEQTHEEMFPRKSVGGLRNPYADPLDPRSGANWTGSSRSRAKRYGRDWH